MFRTMRRFKQQISEEECIRILQEEKRGILSMHGEDGYRQAVKDYEKAQKQVNALEEEAVKALTGES